MTHSGQQQLPLPVQLNDDATFENFLLHGTIQTLVHALMQQADGAGESMIFLSGTTGTGKSHLLQASCHRVGSDAIYLPLSELVNYRPEEIFQGIETLDLICLDDLEHVLGRRDWELALFNLHNRVRERSSRLLIAGNSVPRLLTLELPDLRSRLAWSVVFRLIDPSDSIKQAILKFRAHRRGLDLGEEVCRYILTHTSRDLSALLALLERLDQASLVRQRAVSIPLVKAIINGEAGCGLG
ncbi:MAG: DnaA regulatory inactivator Hda [Pseudomonadota bacterium]